MWKIAFLFCFIISANLTSAIEESNASSSIISYTGTNVGVNNNVPDPSTVNPPDLSRHRAVSAPVAPPVLFSPQPYVMNPKPQDLHASSSADYAYTFPGGSNGYDHYAPPTVYDHHLQHGAENMYHMEDSHHHEDRQVGVTTRDIALGFLTFLIVLSTLQGATLNLMRNPNIVSIMPAGRRRRDIQEQPSIKQMPDKAVFIKIPEGNHVRHAQQDICVITRNIAGVLGLSGSGFGHYISEMVSKSDANGWVRLVANAGSAGLTGADCGSLYRHKDT